MILGFSPVGNVLIYPLEECFPALKNVTSKMYDCNILLGGFEYGGTSNFREKLAFINAAERLLETVRVAQIAKHESHLHRWSRIDLSVSN